MEPALPAPVPVPEVTERNQAKRQEETIMRRSIKINATLSISLALCAGAYAQNLYAEGRDVTPPKKGEYRQVGEMMLRGDAETLHKRRGYSPYAGRNFPTRPLWGDTHLHTDISLDARAFGVTISLDEAYWLARGEQVTATHGERVKLARPLDFE
jgi:hypothetical protein